MAFRYVRSFKRMSALASSLPASAWRFSSSILLMWGRDSERGRLRIESRDCVLRSECCESADADRAGEAATLCRREVERAGEAERSRPAFKRSTWRATAATSEGGSGVPGSRSQGRGVMDLSGVPRGVLLHDEERERLLERARIAVCKKGPVGTVILGCQAWPHDPARGVDGCRRFFSQVRPPAFSSYSDEAVSGQQAAQAPGVAGQLRSLGLGVLVTVRPRLRPRRSGSSAAEAPTSEAPTFRAEGSAQTSPFLEAAQACNEGSKRRR
mmetsp:Transcript_92432/g.198160  ORF Transcript_92432/g.198160 Transcript_92432/m.198160 type:complete len:269 (+) Transcript_92432:665-1471(+)